MDTNHESQASRELDDEFRRILRIIKPYIPCIMNNSYLTSYRLWLEKLSMADVTEKKERNKYIIELCYQIQDGILEFPFTELPGDGPLPPFSMDYYGTKRRTSTALIKQGQANLGKTNLKHDQQTIYFKEMLNTEQLVTQEPHKLPQRNAPDQSELQNIPHKKRTAHTISKNCNNLQGFHDLMNCYISYTNKSSSSPCNSIEGIIDATPKDDFQKNNYFVNKNNDDDSWCDITDGTTTTITQEDLQITHSPTVTPINAHELYKNKIAELMKIINDLQKQNIKLNEDVMGYEHDINTRNTTAERSVHNLIEEINSLRSRLQELTEVKTALKNSQTVAASQWKGIVNSLTTEMQVVQHQNEILQEEIDSLGKQLEEATSRRQQDGIALKQKISIMHEKEIEKLNQAHIKEKMEAENKLNEEISKLTQEYESKIENLRIDHAKMVQTKNNEIQRLESLIEVECKRQVLMHEEVNKIRTQIEETQLENTDANLEKIGVLQKCISKMDKLFKKTERTFNRQIAKLKTEIEMRDKIIHIQLSTQRAEIIANTNVERQVEIDATVEQLEGRYKKLLEAQKSYFLLEKKQDTTVISQLRTIIAQNNIDSDI
ncbi:hypothetical protein RI129_009825 [Pyrocoelia pectoralis]|uniref:DUF4485 domain-containing protein n=1 Tax=Pyrocoelia pectoralis TaxID=417401 RepID=A0AAN7V6U8_9COLE